MLEREPLEVAPPHIRAHALEAARGLLLGGGLVVALLDELEALHAVGEREERHADLRLLGLVGHDVDELRDLLFLADLLGHPGHVVPRQVAVDRLRRELALRDALDDRDRAHLRVAAGEDAGPVGHERAVRDDRLAAGVSPARSAVPPVADPPPPRGPGPRVPPQYELTRCPRG